MSELHPQLTSCGGTWEKGRTPTTILLERDRISLNQGGAMLSLYCIEQACFDRGCEWFEMYAYWRWRRHPLRKIEAYCAWKVLSWLGSAVLAKRTKEEKAYAEELVKVANKPLR